MSTTTEVTSVKDDILQKTSIGEVYERLSGYSIGSIPSFGGGKKLVHCISLGHPIKRGGMRDAHPSCSLNGDKNVVKCFSCGFKSGILGLVIAAGKAADLQGAAEWLRGGDAEAQRPLPVQSQRRRGATKPFRDEVDVASYDYVDADSKLLYRVFRKEGWDDSDAQITAPVAKVDGAAIDIRQPDRSVKRYFAQPLDAEFLKRFVNKTISFSVDIDGMMVLHWSKRFLQARPYYGEGKATADVERPIVSWIYHLAPRCDPLKYPSCICHHPKKPAARRGVRLTPYRLPAITRAIELGITVFLVEGEKCVEALESLGLVATTHSGGGCAPFPVTWCRFLSGLGCLIGLPDGDLAGRDTMLQHLEIVREVPTRLIYADLFPNRADGYDIYNWITERRAEGLTDEAIVALLRALVKEAVQLERMRVAQEMTALVSAADAA